MANYINPSATSLSMEISATATKLINEYFQNPSIAGITIHANVITEINESDISDHMIVDSSGGRISFSDNIALKPRKWQIKGFLKGSALELTNNFIPSLNFQKMAIMQARQLRETMTFKDDQQNSYKVVIERVEFPKEPENQSVLPINLDIKEINVLSAVSSQGDQVKQAANPPSANGAASATSIGNAATIVGSVAAGFSPALTLASVITNYVATDRKGNAV